MRFVESIPCKILDLLEYLVCFCVTDPLLFRSANKVLFLGLHHGRLFLPHSLAEDVGLSHGKSRDLRCDTHDLFLIHDQSFGLLQDGF